MRDIRKRILCALTAAVLLTGCASGEGQSSSVVEQQTDTSLVMRATDIRNTASSMGRAFITYLRGDDTRRVPFDNNIKRADIFIKDGVWEVRIVSATSDPSTDKVKTGTSADDVGAEMTIPVDIALYFAEEYPYIYNGSAVVFFSAGMVTSLAFTPDSSEGIAYTDMPQVTDGVFAESYPWSNVEGVAQSGIVIGTYPYVMTGGELPTTDYRAANEVEDTGPDLETAKAGDIITYGEFEQDNDTSNGKEPIEWLVLENDNGRLTVISKYVLDYGKMNDVYSTSWDQCDVRTWLNKTFYNESFTEEERMHITARAVDGKNPIFSTYVSGGEICYDKVFLLSMKDTADYFPNGHLTNSDYEYYLSDDLIATCTAYAAAKGRSMSSDDQPVTLSAGETCNWWLRSVGNSDGYYSIVGKKGTVSPLGWAGNYGIMGIRPAMQLIADEEDAKLEATIDNAKAGDIITLGSYEQDNDATNGKEPIEWEVLRVDKYGYDQLVLISKKIIDSVPYNKYNEYVYWDTCTLNSWLNTEFYSEAFNSNEQNRIEYIPYEAYRNNNVFMLSAWDITQLYGGELYFWDYHNYYYAPEMIAPCTEYAKAKGCVGRWWLTDEGLSNFGYSYLCVDRDGYINDGMINADNIGVRPVIRIHR